MPVFLPKRQNVSMSVALAEARANAAASEPEIVTFEIDQDTFYDDNKQRTSIFIVNDFQKLTATFEPGAPIKPGQTVDFQPVPVRFTWPEESDSGAPADVTIEIDNASKEIYQHVRHARDADSPIRIRVRTYLPSDTSVPHESPIPELSSETST